MLLKNPQNLQEYTSGGVPFSINCRPPILFPLKTPENQSCLVFWEVENERPSTLLKKRLRHRCFLISFGKFLSTFFDRTPPGYCLCQMYNCSIFNISIICPITDSVLLVLNKLLQHWNFQESLFQTLLKVLKFPLALFFYTRM